jgi:hypothetical protein
MSNLSEDFLKSLVAKLDGDNTVGITLAGSHSRGEGSRYSDVDVHIYVRQKPEAFAEIAFMRCVGDHIVSIYLITTDEEMASLKDPKKAIWAKPGLMQERILLDKDGSIAALKEEAAKNTWEQLQEAANAWASWNLSGCAEEALKILSGLVQRDESKTVNATWGLTREMAATILVQRGVMIQTENSFIDLAQVTAGRDSEWTRLFRLSTSLDPSPGREPAFIRTGSAALRLFQETCRLLKAFLRPEDEAVVTNVLEMINTAGY